MEGMYPAMIFVALALLAVWWLLRTRDAEALKRVVRDIKEHQTAETERVLAGQRAMLAKLLPPREPRKKSRRDSADLPSDYPRDSEG